MAWCDVDGAVGGEVGEVDGVGAACVPDGFIQGGGWIKAVGVVAGVVVIIGSVEVLDCCDVVYHGGLRVYGDVLMLGGIPE